MSGVIAHVTISRLLFVGSKIQPKLDPPESQSNQSDDHARDHPDADINSPVPKLVDDIGEHAIRCNTKRADPKTDPFEPPTQLLYATAYECRRSNCSGAS
jgi:hypothetical protein